jgi:hypothetical protein
MSLLAALLLAVAPAYLEGVNVTAVDSQLGVRVALSGRPGMVSVSREGEMARVSVTDTRLGSHFAGGTRFAWTPAPGFDLATLRDPIRLDRLEVVATTNDVSVLLHVPPEIAIDVRRDRRGLLLVFREVSPAPEPTTRAQVAAPPPAPETEAPLPAAPPPAEPTTTVAAAPAAEVPTAPPVEPTAPPPGPVAEALPPSSSTTDTVELARGLFPAAVAAGAAASSGPGPGPGGSVGDLYAQLFPDGAPQTTAETVETVFETAEVEPGEVVPRLTTTAPISDGKLLFEYTPFLRAFANFPQINRNSHRLSLGLDLPAGPSVLLWVKDDFVTGTLETRDVDPGGEYFFGLGEFRRNFLRGGASVVVGPRTSLELEAGASAVRFQEASTFFDYDTRIATAGLGYELSPNLRAIFDYRYDTLPAPTERPEAEATAHNARVTLSGDIVPLLSGQLMLGYRDQKSPNAGEGGTRYRGFIMSGALTKRFTRKTDVTVYLNRSTPASAFENNAFYVFTALQGSARFPLPLEFQAQGGVGYQWNGYRTASAELGVPREDRILAWYVGLRRPVHRRLFLTATYRRQERRSNLDNFDLDADGFLLQLEWDIFGNTP